MYLFHLPLNFWGFDPLPFFLAIDTLLCSSTALLKLVFYFNQQEKAGESDLEYLPLPVTLYSTGGGTLERTV